MELTRQYYTQEHYAARFVDAVQTFLDRHRSSDR
jgi:hypothetical protein